ncbi:MAG: hypothetical protein H6720_19050 [Sandaracinus sp.]|nr:hypothetical protein [Sandaracinus sp.]
MTAPRVVLRDVEVRGSGSDLGAFHACVWTAPTAEHVTVENLRVRDCAFGIYVQESDFARSSGTTSKGAPTCARPIEATESTSTTLRTS